MAAPARTAATVDCCGATGAKAGRAPPARRAATAACCPATVVPVERAALALRAGTAATPDRTGTVAQAVREAQAATAPPASTPHGTGRGLKMGTMARTVFRAPFPGAALQATTELPVNAAATAARLATIRSRWATSRVPVAERVVTVARERLAATAVSGATVTPTTTAAMPPVAPAARV